MEQAKIVFDGFGSKPGKLKVINIVEGRSK